MNFDYKHMKSDELYSMCLRGDQGAWAHIYGFVLAFARKPKWRLRDTPEDMAQKVMVSLLEGGIHKVKEPAAFRGFVRTVTKNRILDSFKEANPIMVSIHRYVRDENWHFELPSNDQGPEDAGKLGNLMQIITRLLDELPDYCRKTMPRYFRYRMGFGGSYKELSEQLGAPVGTISARVKRCMDMLAKCPELRDWL